MSAQFGVKSLCIHLSPDMEHTTNFSKYANYHWLYQDHNLPKGGIRSYSRGQVSSHAMTKTLSTNQKLSVSQSNCLIQMSYALNYHSDSHHRLETQH